MNMTCQNIPTKYWNWYFVIWIDTTTNTTFSINTACLIFFKSDHVTGKIADKMPTKNDRLRPTADGVIHWVPTDCLRLCIQLDKTIDCQTAFGQIFLVDLQTAIQPSFSFIVVMKQLFNHCGAISAILMLSVDTLLINSTLLTKRTSRGALFRLYWLIVTVYECSTGWLVSRTTQVNY